MKQPPCLYKPGDLVNLDRWDRSERPDKKIGNPGRVTEVRREAHCESGWMIRGVGDSGKPFYLDQNWLAPYSGKPTFQI